MFELGVAYAAGVVTAVVVPSVFAFASKAVKYVGALWTSYRSGK